MLDFRLNSLKAFNDFENPNFGPELDINFDKIIVSGGKLGMQLELSPQDLAVASNAEFADIIFQS